MSTAICKIIQKLAETHTLSLAEYRELILHRAEVSDEITHHAVAVRKAVYGERVLIRGLVEIGNYCKNDCYYCGIRRSNRGCRRYRLDDSQILACCDEGYTLGFRTFVLQGGEDAAFDDDRLCTLIGQIKARYPDCAVTLSLGERGVESFKRLYHAGADRYLLRHETADAIHYGQLHPSNQTLETRLQALNDLKKIGFATGCGFMVGSPYQTPETLAKDLKLIEQLQPEMCGIGPFIPHAETPFAGENTGDAELTCFLLSVVRLICPGVLLPATTALDTVLPDGVERGILAGANVVMPNLSPVEVRNQYALYNGKKNTGTQSAQQLELLRKKCKKIGYTVVIDRGDPIKKKGNYYGDL